MRTLLAAIGTSIFLASSSGAQTLRVQWDRKVDFSRYQTFSWLEGTAAVDPTVNELIRESIENELSVRGIFPDEAEPDLQVVYHASAQEKFEISGGYRRDWEEAAALTVDSHLAGTLVIDLVDAREDRIVWRGTATATVSGNPKKARGRIPTIIEKMFADFPPSS
jgi:hypothetical protein